MSTKILFVGPRGVGKSRAIEAITGQALTRIPLGKLDPGSDAAEHDTEVGYALLSVASEAPTVLLSIPAMENLGAQIFEMGLQGVLGAVLLVDHANPDALQALEHFVHEYAMLARRHALAIVIEHLPVGAHNEALGVYRARLQALQYALPVVGTTTLSRAPLMVALEALVTNAEVEVAHSTPLSDFSPLAH